MMHGQENIKWWNMFVD